MFSVEHASSMGPAVMEEGGDEQQASCLVAKQAVKFPQVLASIIMLSIIINFSKDILMNLAYNDCWRRTSLSFP